MTYSVLPDDTYEAPRGKRVVGTNAFDTRDEQPAIDANRIVNVQPARVVDHVEQEMVRRLDRRARVHRAAAARPHVFDIAELLGREETIERVKNGIAAFSV